MFRKICRFVMLALPLLLLTACGSDNIQITPTLLNPALFPPPGTPLSGPNAHTPVITPLSDGAAVLPGTAPATLPTVQLTTLPQVPATQQSAGGSGGAIVPPGTPTGLVPANGPATACPLPAGWIEYTVQAGDTISELALRASTTVDKLLVANCLVNANVLDVGQKLYLPPNLATAAP